MKVPLLDVLITSLCFPFRKEPLIFLISLSAAAALCAWFFGPFSPLIKGLFIFFGLSYGFSALDRLRPGQPKGEFDGYPISGSRGDSRANKLAWMICLLVVVEAVLDSLFESFPPGYWLSLMALSFMLPTSLIVIAVRNEFFAALNPALAPRIIRAIGIEYFALSGIFLLIINAREVVSSLGGSDPHVQIHFWMPVEVGLSAYFGLVMLGVLAHSVHLTRIKRALS
jgi:hypothetical protein